MDKRCLSWYLTNDQSFVLICKFCNKILEEFSCITLNYIILFNSSGGGALLKVQTRQKLLHSKVAYFHFNHCVPHFFLLL